eukprot:Rmarinus@m.5798
MSFDTVVHSVSIAEFDIDIGNTLTIRYPDFELEEYDYQSLANLCLPDGAHLHTEDISYLLLHVTPKASKKGGILSRFSGKNEKDGATESASPTSDAATSGDMAHDQEDGKVILYGIALFRNKKDDTVRRGAIQKSMLLLSQRPYLNLYEEVLRKAMVRFMDEGDKNALKNVYMALNENLLKNPTFPLWGETITLTLPTLKEDEFPGASLVQLVKTFGSDTMVLWYSIILQQRVLFSGQSARLVGNAALAAPLLVSPLKGFTHCITPYVALTDLAPVMQPHYICGTTNMLFETKSEWYDCVGMMTTGTVTHTQGVKVSIGPDKTFIKNVMNGIEDQRGETWVRNQFKQYTHKFLKRLRKDSYKTLLHRRLIPLKETAMYKRWLAEVQKGNFDVKVEKQALDVLKELRTLADGGGGSALQERKLYYELSTLLNDLDAVEEACENGAVEIVTCGLTNESAQVRKYSAAVLSLIATSVKGQVAILSADLLQRVLEMAEKDQMMNVRQAACECLAKVSTLYIGVVSLVRAGAVDILARILHSPTDVVDTLIKFKVVRTLIQIRRFCPETNKVDLGLLHEEVQGTQDHEYRRQLLWLLDLYGERVYSLVPSEQANTLIQSCLTAPSDAMSKIAVCGKILSEIIQDRSIILELVHSKVIDEIEHDVWGALFRSSQQGGEHESKLARLSLAVLTAAADTHAGRVRLLELNTINTALKTIKSTSSNLLFLSKLLRFFEVLAQHKSTVEVLVDVDVAQEMLAVLRLYHDKQLLARLCRAPLMTLRHMHRVLVYYDDAARAEMLTAQIASLMRLYLSVCVMPEEKEAVRAAIEKHSDVMSAWDFDSISLTSVRAPPEPTRTDSSAHAEAPETHAGSASPRLGSSGDQEAPVLDECDSPSLRDQSPHKMSPRRGTVMTTRQSTVNDLLERSVEDEGAPAGGGSFHVGTPATPIEVVTLLRSTLNAFKLLPLLDDES